MRVEECEVLYFKDGEDAVRVLILKVLHNQMSGRARQHILRSLMLESGVKLISHLTLSLEVTMVPVLLTKSTTS